MRGRGVMMSYSFLFLGIFAGEGNAKRVNGLENGRHGADLPRGWQRRSWGSVPISIHWLSSGSDALQREAVKFASWRV
jgi:hypothetical protein